jgi:YggT family protein
MINMAIDIVYIITNVMWWIIIVQVIMSWAIAFNIINTYNDVVAQIWMVLEKMTAPLYKPFRRFMPDFGGLDLTPMLVLILIMIVQNAVLPNLRVMAMGLT